jgi:hypothetical protein
MIGQAMWVVRAFAQFNSFHGFCLVIVVSKILINKLFIYVEVFPIGKNVHLREKIIAVLINLSD